jgi:hypothetical protein
MAQPIDKAIVAASLYAFFICSPSPCVTTKAHLRIFIQHTFLRGDALDVPKAAGISPYP